MRNKTILDSYVPARMRDRRAVAYMAVILTILACGALLYQIGSAPDPDRQQLELIQTAEFTQWADGSSPFGQHERLHVRSGVISGGSRSSMQLAGVPEALIPPLKKLVSAHGPTEADGLRFKIAFASPEPASNGDGPRLLALQIGEGKRSLRVIRFPLRGDDEAAFYDFHGNPLESSLFAWPVSQARVSSCFGGRIHPVHRTRLFHRGIDLAAPAGTPVIATASGTVTFVGKAGGYGNLVVLRHANGLESYYAHLHTISGRTRIGTAVSQRDVIGTVGATGTATGPHLHFEIRERGQPLDPISLLPSRKGNQNENPRFLRDVHAVLAHFAPEGVAMQRFVRLYSSEGRYRI